MQISNQPPKGTYDWFPEEYKIRKYLFDTWRSVCTRFGYNEYLTPLVEYADIYKAKSGEDVGGKELTTFKDRAGRELAIRPEMTPSITRMISKKYSSMQKPIRYFSIANFFRNEKPQKGRNREFWQLNFDIFGDDSINSDVEILQIALEIMLSFNPPKNSFKLYLNNRKLVNDIFDKFIDTENKELRTKVIRTLDKLDKLNKDAIEERLLEDGVSEDKVSLLYKIFSSENEEVFIKEYPEIENTNAYKESLEIMSTLESLGYGDFIEFKLSLMRGFDYYDGMIFEVFDTNLTNPRAMFGGGRYNGLASIFGSESFPAVGSAPGDETLRIFLENWNLIDSIKKEIKDTVYFLPILDESLKTEILKLGNNLRKTGKSVIQGLSVQGLKKSLDEANKKEYDFVIIYGEYEKNDGIYKIKNMKTGEEEEVEVTDLRLAN